MGQLQHGVYMDDLEGVDPASLAQHYGVDEPNHTGEDGESDGESDEEVQGDPTVIQAVGDVHEPQDDGEEAAIAQDQAGNFNDPDAVNVPQCLNPFADATDYNSFVLALDLANTTELIPEGYGLFPDEWDDIDYPSVEVLRSGRRGTGEIIVGLPEHVWRPRAELWGRALDIMIRLLDAEQ